MENYFLTGPLRVLFRIEERLRDVGSGNVVTRMTELEGVQLDLTELEDECSEVAAIFKACEQSVTLVIQLSSLL